MGVFYLICIYIEIGYYFEDNIFKLENLYFENGCGKSLYDFKLLIVFFLIDGELYFGIVVDFMG